MSGKKNPLSVYAVVSQIAFVIIAPLIIFLVGGNAAVKHFGWDDGVMIIFVLLGIIFMIGGAVSYFMKLIRLYGRDKKDTEIQRKIYGNPADNDYYDEYKNLRK